MESQNSFRNYFHSLWLEPRSEKMRENSQSQSPANNSLKCRKSLGIISSSVKSGSSGDRTESSCSIESVGLFDQMLLCCLGDASDSESETEEEGDDGRQGYLY